MENKNLNRLARRVLYSMKRQYGNQLDLYKMVSSETDHLTGEKTVVKEVHRIRRGIVMPSRLKREQTQTISIIATDNRFVYGGAYDLSTRMFIIDPRDLPTDYEIVPTDYFAYRHQRWDIFDAQKDEGLAGAWIVLAKHVPNMPVYEIIDILVSSDVTLSDETQNEELAQQLRTRLNLAPNMSCIRYPNTGHQVSNLNLAQDVDITVE